MVERSNRFPTAARVKVLQPGQRKPKRAPGRYTPRLDRDIRVDSSLLERFCFAGPSPFGIDLCVVLGATRFADRAVKRLLSRGWPRSIQVEVPLYERERWSDKSRERLEACLAYLTGDQWQFSFVQRTGRPDFSGKHESQLVNFPDGPRIAVPYSGGLDSYAQVKLLLERQRDAQLICAYTDYTGGVGSWESLCRARKGEIGPILTVPVPFRIKEPRHSEPTFRSRAFIFYSLAAYAATLAGSEEVLIPENGQGSLAGSLVLLGSEAPHRSCYPGFLRRLSDALANLFGRRVAFSQPGLFQTKGQALKELARFEPPAGWVTKFSCSHNQRHSTVDGKRAHCGVCGGCLLRRTAMHAAGTKDQTVYLFSDLAAPNLESALAEGQNTWALAAMKDVAGNSARDMQRLANFSAASDDPRLLEVALDVAEATGIEFGDALGKTLALVHTHSAEWGAFLNQCGPKSWVTQYART